jgi:hypothetical protein
MDDSARRLAQLLDLLDESVVIRPNGDTFQVVRENGSVRCLPVDVHALAGRRRPATIGQPVNRSPLSS